MNCARCQKYLEPIGESGFAVCPHCLLVIESNGDAPKIATVEDFARLSAWDAYNLGMAYGKAIAKK